MRSFLLFCTILLTGAAAAQDAITCTGLWAPATTEQALIRQFGRTNVVRESIYIAEGDETPGTIVFPNDETKRLEIVWRDARQRRRPEWIRVPAGSRWTAIAGLRGGMTLAEVEKINGRPFQLSGFDWDYGGMVGDWRGGALSKLKGPCRVQVQFDRTVPDAPTRAQQRAIDATSGDRELLSSSPDLRRFPVRVSEIVIQYVE